MGWWFVSFKNSYPISFDLTETVSNVESFQQSDSFPFSPIDRNLLHKALQGDFVLMARLISDWDVEAQILQSQGIEGIQRLPHTDFLQSQLIIREKKPVLSPELVVDDNNTSFRVKEGYQKFLPQTFMAASFLLAASPPEQIAALPQGMRDQTHLYPQERMKQVSLDINRLNAEKLYMVRPDIAFVAHYSHPATLHALEQQGVQLFTIKNVETIEDITKAFTRMGHLINRPQEAELLKLFMEASFLAIDNHLMAIKKENRSGKDPLRFLYLNYYSQFSIPHSTSLTGHLLKRLGIDPLIPDFHRETQQWKLPIAQEQIVNLNPDVLIISTTQAAGMRQLIQNNSALSQLPAVRKNQIYFVDEIVQESPSQYLVLAYYDLFYIMAEANREEQTLFVQGDALHD